MTGLEVSVIKNQILFIVGNSRSGTTMMRRVLGNHPDIFMLEEMHFFEQLWSSSDADKILNTSEAITLASRLFFIQRNGYLSEIDFNLHKADAEKVVNAMQGKLFPHEIFKAFMFFETHLHNKTIPCQKTPQDVFYIKEILELFPEASIINMVRDPRGVLLSQKRKWQRRNMGASFMTKKEQRRLKINYHPITISKLWNSSQQAALHFADNENVRTVIFEKLVETPDSEVRALCTFLKMDFKETMLNIPHVGSSNEADAPNSFGIKSERAGNWEKGGLNNAEVQICQNICKKFMLQYGYTIADVKANIFQLTYYYISFPFKIILALLFNLHRMKNIGEAIKRRLG
ncbi:MAG: sulfotransferase [Chitinophagales bacterium]